MRIIHVCPIHAILQEVNDQTVDFILCSAEMIIAKPSLTNVLSLRFSDTQDEKHPMAFRKEQAKRIAAFLQRDGHNQEVFVCCDAGESRSAAIAAALMLSDGQTDEAIWRSAEYHPNTLVFKMMCHEMGVPMDLAGIEQRKKYNEHALQMAIQQNRKRM